MQFLALVSISAKSIRDCHPDLLSAGQSLITPAVEIGCFQRCRPLKSTHVSIQIFLSIEYSQQYPADLQSKRMPTSFLASGKTINGNKLDWER
jgi:hypothetical protein